MTYNIIFTNKTISNQIQISFYFQLILDSALTPSHALIVKSLPNIRNKIFLYLNPL